MPRSRVKGSKFIQTAQSFRVPSEAKKRLHTWNTTFLKETGDSHELFCLLCARSCSHKIRIVKSTNLHLKLNLFACGHKYGIIGHCELEWEIRTSRKYGKRVLQCNAAMRSGGSGRPLQSKSREHTNVEEGTNLVKAGVQRVGPSRQRSALCTGCMSSRTWKNDICGVVRCRACDYKRFAPPSLMSPGKMIYSLSSA